MTGTVELGPARDLVEVDVPVGGRVLVVSDLLLEKDATPATTSATTDVATAIDAWDGPGILVIAGNLFEMVAADVVDTRQALDAHPKLTAAVAAFRRCEGRRVICLPGSKDGRLAWDDDAFLPVARELGAERALAVTLRLDTGAGRRTVRVEPGHRFDPRSACVDPRSPADTPLSHHLVTEILPSLGPARATWLAGVERLADASALPRFLASRLVYRRAARYAWWLLVPFVAALVLKVPLVTVTTDALHRRGVVNWSNRLLLLGLTTAVDLALVVIGVAFLTHRAWAAVSGVTLGLRGREANEAARAEARAMVTAGHAGLVTGHTMQSELTHLGRGFYANTGASTEVVEECPARFGMPPVFLHRRRLSWVELEAGADLHVRLLQSHLDLPGRSPLERLVARRLQPGDVRPSVVAAFPQGRSWPATVDPRLRMRRVRRWGAAAIAIAGLLDFISAVTPPWRERLEVLLRWFPLGVSQAASAGVALAGVALVLLSRGVRRGQRQAWSVSVAILVGSAVLHVVKGGDLEEAAVAAGVAAFLLRYRGAFTAAVDRPSRKAGLMTLAGGGLVVTALATGAVEFVTATRHPTRLALPRAVTAVVQRLVGVRAVALPHRLDEFLTPTLVAVALGLATLALWLAFRPVVQREGEGADQDSGLDKARDIVKRHASGTLDYFALRTDKQWWFWGDSAVAYAVYSGVCLVSPDPIGPDAERDEAWRRFRRFADGQGWTLAVLGAGEEWLPVYRASGMHDMYAGDEGVVDVTRFSLEGGRHKGLRQAVNRIARYGYTSSFHDPATASPELREGLRQLLDGGRKGDVERGFSMTLGRLFDTRDHGLLLAVAHAADGTPVAFCQYVPAPGIDGYSLDLMRRDDGEHPNGLIDFLVVETIRHLRDRGLRSLGLNFATMRAVLAGEAGDSLTQRVERWLLRRMSGSMQIESLWRFNAKYDPTWQPRYVVYDAP
ncbi:MAG TPA: phosphatidylglycerol lysyltransferase domain-containing protein, partial [Acidimicrobiales bacterium]|nr:phosphatidylglycerol lysyltransferase domain-containing protein [Acidimicrobiales bacterium]